MTPNNPPSKRMIVAVDFDGTLVKHAYPEIGDEVPHAFDWLKKLQTEDVHLILWTIRSGKFLMEAIDFCLEREIMFWGVNYNPEQSWSKSPKAYAHVYVDDAAMGTPLVYPQHNYKCSRWYSREGASRSCDCEVKDERPYVNWEEVGPLLVSRLLAFRLSLI